MSGGTLADRCCRHFVISSLYGTGGEGKGTLRMSRAITDPRTPGSTTVEPGSAAADSLERNHRGGGALNSQCLQQAVVTVDRRPLIRFRVSGKFTKTVYGWAGGNGRLHQIAAPALPGIDHARKGFPAGG